MPRPASELPQLSNDEIQRYSRHLLLPELGMDGQRRLKGARVLMVGAGGLGSPVGLYLAAAGVGRIGLVEFDQVDVTNLQRQVLHGTKDVGRPKLRSAIERMRDLNPHVEVTGHAARLGRDNALELVRSHDLVVDGTDNFATRYLVNDACVLAGRPNVYASIFRFEGQASVFATAEGPCYRCLYPSPPPPGAVPSCAEGGVLGVLPGLLGVVQATEALKLLTGIGEPLVGRLLLVDALGMQFRTVKVRRDPRCPACGTREILALQDYEALCAGPAAHDAPPATGLVVEITPTELAAKRERRDDFQLVDVRDPHEWAIGRIPGATLLPLGGLPGSAGGALDPAREVVVYCKGGVRSRQAAAALAGVGFTRVSSLAGGILRYSDEVDRTIPRY